MAEGHSLTLRAALDKVMGEEHADVVRERVAAFVAELMEAEVAQQIGAELHEKAPGRVAQRNGYRSREWETRAGTIELEVVALGQLLPGLLGAANAARAGVGGGGPGATSYARSPHAGCTACGSASPTPTRGCASDRQGARLPVATLICSSLISTG